MEFEDFARHAEEIEMESSDTGKISLVAELLKESGDEVDISARFIHGEIFPSWDDRKISIGPSLLYESLSIASGESNDSIEELVKDEGDIGRAAASLDLSGQHTLVKKELTLSYIYESLEEIASAEGDGSQSKKTRILADLFIECSETAAKYLARLVMGEMRVGVGEGTVRDGIAEAFEVDVELVERGIMVTNDIGRVAIVGREEGETGLKSLKITIGRPVKPMLAQAGDLESVIEELRGEQGVLAEWKYDGARLQIHIGDEGEIELYSRNLESLTESLPDAVDIIRTEVDESSVILDAEVVAMEGDEPLPFQELLKRLRRKYRIEEMTEEVSLEINVFDVIYRGDELIDEDLLSRKNELSEITEEISADYWLVKDTDEVTEIETEALTKGHEGIMAKNPESTYTPGKRGKNWLKIKPEPETLDLVVTGGEWGEGRRANLIGSYLLSARQDDDLMDIGRVATGLTDEKLEELTELFRDLIVAEDGKEIDFKPEVVFEVGYEEIQKSPNYSSGFALRFPRFIRIREDKDVSDSDSVQRVENLYNN